MYLSLCDQAMFKFFSSDSPILRLLWVVFQFFDIFNLSLIDKIYMLSFIS